MPSKVPRATLAQKVQVLDYYHQSESPQLKTVDRFKEEISISTSSLSEWLKNEQELRRRFAQADFKASKNSRRKATFKYEKINSAMDKLVQEKMLKNEAITEPILRKHWAIYAQKYGVDDPKRLHSFSHGWLSQFKKRHGIKKNRIQGEEQQPLKELSHESHDFESHEEQPSVLSSSSSSASSPPPPPPPPPQQPQSPQNKQQNTPPKEPSTSSITIVPATTIATTAPTTSVAAPPFPVSVPKSYLAEVEVEKFIFVTADKFFLNHQESWEYHRVRDDDDNNDDINDDDDDDDDDDNLH
ncbi:hypothetical protein KGF56_002298 [Candida oxycetoniae]|uniref:HTH CENPB-type domain-containing protein n=1 Tax=Candida oxycetoniae TaxID=497107 RepID=A0AAI9SXM3_9ASCO|nr:uncharacterized protein KGF56_002298 [Candida oxycetoniae]KAI3404882.2 hypothetical protein KGF56_002298 [Candida oxycetoniae]